MSATRADRADRRERSERTPRPERTARPERTVSPIAKLGATMVLGVCLIITIDIVSAGTALVLLAVSFPLLRIELRRALARAWPVLLAAPLTALTIALYGQTSGTIHFEFLLMRVSDGSLELAGATGLRVLAIGLPAVMLFIDVDPTDLADGLAQLLRLPARFVLGALAALRLGGLLVEDWRALELARRARGIGDRARLRRIAGQGFALLVLAVRRGSSLATAMEARGFRSARERTWARPARFGLQDVAVVALGAAIGAAAITASVLTGSWNAIVG